MIDEDGFVDFYERTREPLHRALLATLGDPQLAVEAGDEAMVRAAERWSQVARMQQPDGWVYRVAVNWATSWRRKWGRRPTLPVEALDRVHLDASAQDLVDVLAPLPLQQRQILVLRHVLGYSTLETAAALGVAEGTVKSGLHRARRRLLDERDDVEVPDGRA